MADAFQPRFVDLVRNYTTTAGTADFVLGTAVNGFTSFSAALSVGDRFYYSAAGVDRPNETEVGRGSLQADGTIRREPIGGVKTNFSSGTKTVALVAAAEWFTQVQAGGSADGAAVAATRAALASAASSTPTLLTEPRREGLFVFEAANLSSMVGADSRQAVYVAPSSDPTGASGAWVRRRDRDELHIDWFGAAGDGETDDLPAFVALRTLASALSINAGSGLKAGPTVQLGHRTYALGSSYSWKGCTNIWQGTDSGLEFHTPGSGSTIQMGLGATFTIERAATENGSTGTSISGFSGEASCFRNIRFAGPGKGEGNAPVVKLRGRATFYDCRFVDGGSHGLQIEASAGAGTNFEGNANAWKLIGGVCSRNGGSGVAVGLVAAADVNAGLCLGTSFVANGRYGIEHNGFLGDRFLGIHCDLNTLGHVRQTNPNAACVFDGYFEVGYPAGTLGGRSYASGPGAAAAFPSGPVWGANNGRMAATALETNSLTVIGDCSASGVLAAGGSTIGAGTALLRTYYSAGALHLDGYDSASGHIPIAVDAASTSFAANGGLSATIGASGIALAAGKALHVNGTAAIDGNRNANFAALTVGSTSFSSAGLALMDDADAAAQRSTLGLSAVAATGSGADLSPASVSFAKVQNIAASKLLGRASAGAGTVEELGLAGGLTLSGGNLTLGAATPNSIAATGAITSSGGGMGYTTGAGGTVSQATSKTGGVTLHKLCGQITMNAAALAASTTASFVLTNSNIAAGDLLILNHAAGGTGGAYLLNAQCSAGSATINVRNVTAASLSEAIVIAFAVQKAVTA